MVQENRDRAIGAFLSISLMLLATGCPFEEKLYGAGSSGEGGSDAQTATTGGPSSGSGPPAVQCPVADPVQAFDALIESYSFEISEPRSCYALYNIKRTWSEARTDCTELASSGVNLNARLVEVSDSSEHQSILKWLIDLRAGTHMGAAAVNFDGAWTLGFRSRLENDPLKSGAFYWAVQSQDAGGQDPPSNPPWNIFPSPGCDNESCKKKYWGNGYGSGSDQHQQPDSVADGGDDCVRYAIGDNWDPYDSPQNPTFPGLADSSCENQERKWPYICEWSPQ